MAEGNSRFGYDPAALGTWSSEVIKRINGDEDSIEFAIRDFIAKFNEIITKGYWAGPDLTKKYAVLKEIYGNIATYYKNFQDKYIEVLGEVKDQFKAFQESYGAESALLFDIPTAVALPAMVEEPTNTTLVNYSKPEIESVATDLQTRIAYFKDTSVAKLVSKIQEVGGESTIWYGGLADSTVEALVAAANDNAGKIEGQLNEVVSLLNQLATDTATYL